MVGGKKITIVDHQNWALLHKRWHLTEVKKTYPSIVKVPVSRKSASHWTTLLNVLSGSMPACAVGDTTGILVCAFYVRATKVGSPVSMFLVNVRGNQWWANLDQASKDLDKTIFRDLSPTPIP